MQDKLSPTQQLTLASVNGEPWLDIPDDLFIPPDAMEVILEQFEGPLDLLLYLIRKQKLDIERLPVLAITQQYMEYIEAMRMLKLELAAEYLVMAALLTEIKSRTLLPVQEHEQEELDPRAELIRRLQEYELYKDATEKLDTLPRQQRDTFDALVAKPDELPVNVIYPEVTMDELLQAMRGIAQRVVNFEHHEIKREKLSTRQRMSDILAKLQAHQFVEFTQLFSLDEGRSGLVVSFLAILELIKEGYIKCVQSQPLMAIQVILVSAEEV
ncbi:ScpA family protein [Agarivorans sp. 1_MG-2023]|uniref:segregation and condensation protein A n=1 Tax=Agarivorans sp. 1_MG-2023 TaxID=3062634 RepID=UPI0026E425EB|nr:ScpA family protein [Agarivorans sp. 1_MG-2023]MDO6765273.1 ScpA family protein [Agarivorans sp. 1_MG-2023]